MKNVTMNDTYAQKVADITHVPFDYIVQLRALGFFDNKSVRDLLIRHDYCKLIQSGKLTKAQILAKLEGMYNASASKIWAVVKQNRKRLAFCCMCGAQISPKEHEINGGKCYRCFSKTVKL